MATTRLHGHDVAYELAGDGPPIVLIHGITSSLRTWDSVFAGLAEHHTVLAPDMLGHGRSGKPRGDYSLGAYASGVRDLMALLGIAGATIVGHSLGGGIAMQFAYQFPTRVDRLVLVDSGGLGTEVSPALRAATLPGADLVLPLLFNARTRAAGRAISRTLSRVGLSPTPAQHEVLSGLDSLAVPDARNAFAHTARAVIGPGGQRVDARDRLYLAAGVPTLLVWGERDRIIPVGHGRRAHTLMPHSRLEIFPRAGHFPFSDAPRRFIEVLEDFIATTAPADLTEDAVSELLRHAA
jgi:pimeloyl-ACP methyl ester carboxylesterase